jgi:hypothetical protein
MLRFHFPLIEPDGRFSRIRLSDKESRLFIGHAFAHGKLRGKFDSRISPSCSYR